MRYESLVFATLIAFCACSSPNERGQSGNPYAKLEADTARTTSAPDKAPRPTRPQVKITTVGEMADAMGVHWNYLFLANNACSMNIPCRHQRGQPVLPVDQCEEHLTREWCRGGECKESFMSEPAHDDPCRLDVIRRTCDEMDRPISCPGLRDSGLELRPTDWPKGALPPDRWQVSGYGRGPR